MKVIYTLITFLTIFLNSSLSQNGWFVQNSNISNSLNEVFFISNNKGWIAANSGKILRTVNGGDNWEVQQVSSYGNFNSVHFINENTGWAAGGENVVLPLGFLYKTTNGGLNWINVFSSGGSEIKNVFFVDPYIGFISSDNSGGFTSEGILSRTTNSGTNWELSSYGSLIIEAINFKDINTGWAVGSSWSDVLGDSIKVIKTTNAGFSWFVQYRSTLLSPQSETDISVIGNNIWVSGKDSVILHSSNGGDDWITQSVGTPNSLNSIFFINDNTGWAGGFRSDSTNMVKTTNGGQSWFKLQNPNSTIVNSIFFTDAYTGWAVNSNGIILKTITGGLTSVNSHTSLNSNSFYLSQNYPNPFNPVSHFEFTIPESGFISLKVYDVLGNVVSVLVNEKKIPGTYSVSFDGSNFPSGVYFYKLESENFQDTKRMMLLK